MTSNNKNVFSQRIKKHCKIYDGLLPGNVDRGPSLQRGLMNAQLQNFQQYDKSFNDWSLGKQLFCFLESQVLMTIGAAPGTSPWWDKTRPLAGVLEEVFVLKMKAKCGPSTKTQVFQNTFHFKARTEESVILLV